MAVGSPGRLGVMGGTFDPIHLGHLVAASEAAHALGLDRVLFVPAGVPWQRSGYTDSEDRYTMAALAVGGDPRFAVSRVELDRRGPSYTADTLELLRSFYGSEVSLFLIAGADAVANLGTWKHLERVRENAEVVALARPGFSVGDTQADWPRVHFVEMPLIGVSGTDIRKRVASGAPIDFLVPTSVAEFIRREGLYSHV